MAGPSGPAFLFNFYPRSPCGERQPSIQVQHLQRVFLSTLSLRRATAPQGCFTLWRCYFYPRSPCGERPPRQGSIAGDKMNFYPRSPCGERLTDLGVGLYLVTISIHALLAESDVLPLMVHPVSRKFLSTLSLRRATSRYCICIESSYISIHALLAESDLNFTVATAGGQ